ncbi:methyltransferase [Actinomadura keratinilytica]
MSTPSLPLTDRSDLAPRLRTAFLDADFTADGLLERLGAPAYAALARAETVPALRATRGGTPLDTLVRLFLLQCPVTSAEAEAALPGGLLGDAVEGGWLRRDAAGEAGGEVVRAVIDVRPYGGPDGQDWFIASDLGCAVGGAGGIGSAAEGVVLGVGGASTTLAGLTVRGPVGDALDLGTGSGIQALHASVDATRVTATDLNPRALRFAALTLALSGAPGAELLEGSLFEPVDGNRYDLIVSNPPFVISPGARLTYRDGGMSGDDLCRTLVQQAGDRLNEGGTRTFWPTGSTSTVRSGATGSVPGCRRAATPGSCSARCRTSPSTPNCGCATPATTAPTRRPTRPGTRRGWTSSRRGTPRRSASAGSRSAAVARPSRRSSWRSGRTPSSSPSARRSAPTSPARTTCARTTTRPCSPGTSP